MPEWLNLLSNYLSLPLACHASQVRHKSYWFFLACLGEFHTLLWKCKLQQDPTLTCLGFSPMSWPSLPLWPLLCTNNPLRWELCEVLEQCGLHCKTTPSQRLSCDMPRVTTGIYCARYGFVLLTKSYEYFNSSQFKHFSEANFNCMMFHYNVASIKT